MVHVIVAALSLTAFLAGLRALRYGLQSMSAGRLQQALQAVVKTPTRGVITGFIATAFIQSSAAVTAMTVGLVAAGSMTFSDAIGVVLGSNVGSTVIPQLLNFDLWNLAVVVFVLGLAGLASRRRRLLNPSVTLLGFATIFISLQSLTGALAPLSHSPWFAQALNTAGSNPIEAVLAGTLASALVQSSTATTVITMALAKDGLIPLHGGIALVLGANIGTCLTAILAALGQSREAQQVALAHVLLNVGGAFLFLPLLAPFADLNRWLSENPAQQIANAHTLYNMACTLLVWPFTTSFGNFVRRLLPDKLNT